MRYFNLLFRSFSGLLLAILILLSFPAFAQGDLFDSDEIIDVKMQFSVKDIRKDTNDSTFVDEIIWLKDSEGNWEEIPVELRVRGNFRLTNCYYPPLRMKIKKKNREGTIFEENKSLKVVFPCSRAKNADSYVAKEFMAYQIFEEVSEYTFQTRMMRITFINEDDRKQEEIELLGFLLEDDDDVADRFDGEILEGKKILGSLMEPLPSVRHDYFQMLIGNTDFSSLFRHNSKILLLPEERLIPLAYDFDMTGLVNPPYAQVSNLVDIEKVTDRLYRGFCRERDVFDEVRTEFLEKEGRIMEIASDYESYLSPAEYRETSRFLGDFFDILRNDKAFENQIVSACRSY
ncbi:hypothetical protein [Algoriphagus limi]|uniref:DUF3857 domain-containing protein n=1 Tax=Algoriphagus limi TaxID=2975273 RepID=A0ABT2G520_9BACT|nr:hypothetical protein [Algoriphagus limi]MCS5489878.1 hypothetical protein [Algoriphagus limi]